MFVVTVDFFELITTIISVGITLFICIVIWIETLRNKIKEKKENKK